MREFRSFINILEYSWFFFCLFFNFSEKFSSSTPFALLVLSYFQVNDMRQFSMYLSEVGSLINSSILHSYRNK